MKTVDITIKQKDVEELQYSASGCLVEELALSAGEWDYEDMRDANMEYLGSWAQTVRKEWNYERTTLDALNKIESEKDLLEFLGDAGTEDDQWTYPDGFTWKAYEAQELQLGAYLALEYPDDFARLVEMVEAQLGDDVEGYADEFARLYAPDFTKAVQEADDGEEDELRRQWLHGDRSDTGTLDRIRKFYGAEDITYDDKKGDCITFSFDPDIAREQVANNYGEETKYTDKMMREHVLSEIKSSAKLRADERKRKSEARKAERERLSTYKAGQAAEAKARKEAELRAMRK